ncbi:hypothetical protein L7G72_16420 [Xenorhabdus bovienii]|uniref:hypothetical protein n=1 Tax=Xenorhabdus bovienii TaxID=40576 RepID=UPI001EE12BD8|nr:hypothetical protein [Xenorhabdus bovienii]MCG3463389.1 hypothetical protein [Xenorhabdus bovienii]
MGKLLCFPVMVMVIAMLICNIAEAKSPYDGDYLCKINKELNDVTIKNGGMYFFPTNLDTARVSYRDESFTIYETRPEVFMSPKLTPITKFGILNKKELTEMGENTLIYGGEGRGLGYFRPSQNEFFISKIKIPNVKGAYILSLEHCVKQL